MSDEMAREKRPVGRPKGSKKISDDRMLKDGHQGSALSYDEAQASQSEVASDFNLGPYGEGYTQGIVFGSGGLPKLPGVLNMTIPGPNDYANQARWAIEYRGQKFIKGALVRRRKFIINGFKHHHQDPRVVKLFDQIVKKTKFVKILKNIQFEKDTVGWVVAWPDQINLIPEAVYLLQGNVRIERLFGIDKIFLTVDSKLIDAIKAYPDRFPAYFTEAVTDKNKLKNNGMGKYEIELLDAYLISSFRDIGESYPKSPLYPLFEPVKIIDGLIEAEHAVSFAIKRLIMHATVKGELDTTSGKYKRATKGDINNVSKQILNGAKTASIVTDEGININFVSPDKEVFTATQTPYNQAMERIWNNIGIPALMVSGNAAGVSYSTATFIIKAFLQDIIDEREDLVLDFVDPWYEKIAEALYDSDPVKYAFLRNDVDDEWNIPHIQFNETELKNIVELLAILKFLQDTGAQSIESAFEMLQLDFPTEKARKQRQNNDDGYIYRPYEPSQGMAHSRSFDNPQQMNIDLDQKRLKLDTNTAENADNNAKQQINIQKKSLVIKAKTPVANVGNAALNNVPAKPVGKAGKPAKPPATPHPSNETRNPRATATASEISVNQLMEMLDNPEVIDDLLQNELQRMLEDGI